VIGTHAKRPSSIQGKTVQQPRQISYGRGHEIIKPKVTEEEYEQPILDSCIEKPHGGEFQKLIDSVLLIQRSPNINFFVDYIERPAFDLFVDATQIFPQQTNSNQLNSAHE